MQLALLSLFLVITALLVMRAIARERREYDKFKRLRSTVSRQKVYRKWLVEGFLMFGGLSAAVLLATSQYVPLVLQDAATLVPLAAVRDWLGSGFGAGFAIGAAIAFLAVILIPILLLRKQDTELPLIGDIGALLPRTRAELWYGAGLSVNAGIFEELLFRLGMPALLFGIIGNGPVAFGIAVLIFGALHLYQGWAGVLVTTALGLALSVIYVLSGSILLVMAIHALLDLRSLVLLPGLMIRVARKDEVTTAPQQ